MSRISISIFIFAISLSIPRFSISQDISFFIDSLANELKRAQDDTSRSLVLAELSYRIYQNPDSAFKLAQKGLQLAESQNFLKGIAANHFSLGNYYALIDDHSTALAYLYKALNLYLEIGEINEQVRTYFFIGTLAAQEKDYAKSKSYLKEAFDLSKKRKENTFDKVLLLNNLGTVYIHTGELDSSYIFLQQGLKTAQALQSKELEAVILQSMAELNLARGNYLEAEELLLESISLNKDADRGVQITNYLDLGEVYLETMQTDKALRYATLANHLATKLADLEAQQRAANLLYKIFKKSGNEKEALAYLEQSIIFRDSIYSFDKIKEMRRLQATLDFTQKELKIKILQQENALREADIKSHEDRVANQRFITTSLILLLALITSLLLFIRKQNRVRKMFIYDLQKKNEQILDQNNEIRLLNETLEERVEQRTASITAQKRKLEEYSFLNAHRLRGPVATLLGLLHLIDIKSLKPEELPQILDQVQEQVKQIDHVVNEINRAIE